MYNFWFQIVCLFALCAVARAGILAPAAPLLAAPAIATKVVATEGNIIILARPLHYFSKY